MFSILNAFSSLVVPFIPKHRGDEEKLLILIGTLVSDEIKVVGFVYLKGWEKGLEKQKGHVKRPVTLEINMTKLSVGMSRESMKFIDR
ncbi:CLUMA_CG000895, isoform A [Clunio marinus]|uniref:CLUMA_CG000895, isoform A n=1 Tax=Clunio marinus TaxID=568069 RepID=A0A1J1HI32_9DIPT|nr:CLUMA_CG000895, isoform A [Clunio marinus]